MDVSAQTRMYAINTNGETYSSKSSNSSCRLILYFDRQKLGTACSFSYDTLGGFGMTINAIIAQSTKVNHIFKRVEYLKLFIFYEV